MLSSLRTSQRRERCNQVKCNFLILSNNQTIIGVEVFHCQGLRQVLYWLHMSLSAQVYQLPSDLASPVRSLKHLIANSVIKESTLSDHSS